MGWLRQVHRTAAAPTKATPMVDHALLHRELAQLASALKGDVDLHEGLHQLSLTTAAALGLAGAGVTLHMPDGRTQYVTATDAPTLHVERVQDSLKEGACVDAIEQAGIVAVDDLTVDERWPRYRPAVLEAGYHAVAAVPIPFEDRCIGAINLYGAESRAWTTEEFSAGLLLADLAAGYLVNTHLLRTTQTLAAQLQQALDSRIIIEQAKGILAERHRVTPPAAFAVLRAHARKTNSKLRDLANDVVSGSADPYRQARGDAARR
jgi:GAF domain-containing protein